MRTTKTIAIVLAIGFLGTACTKVPAGNVGVKVYLLGKEKGVDTEELSVGRYWIGMNEELYLFPTFKQNYVWTADEREGSPNDESFTFQTAEGLEVGADVGITYHLDPNKINSIFQKYRRGIEEITDQFLRNQVRDAFNSVASAMPVESVYGEGKNRLLEEVQKQVMSNVGPEGIIIEKVYLIGSFRLPQTVVKSLNAKIEATQRAQQRENEIREAEAEAKKKIAEAQGVAEATLRKAQAEAEANRIVSRSLTPTLVSYEKIKKWNGAPPQVQGGATPFITLSTKSDK